jgi:hypothetical protein
LPSVLLVPLLLLLLLTSSLPAVLKAGWSCERSFSPRPAAKNS